ncbi:B3 domain-containing protein [Hirschfeldia incana]|nr:B3 domain-containing protein [Hirschfeldia incana]
MVTTRQTKARVTTSSHRRQLPEPDSSVKKFFNVVLPSTMKKNMLMIPPRFVKLQGSTLSEVVTLETPVGFRRSVKLKRIGEEIWLHGGWSEFAEAHSISEGHFLFFDYKGNSCFSVMIFNVSACEIDYPLDAVHISDSDDEVMDVTDEEFLGTQGTRGNDQTVDGENNPKKRPRDEEFDKILNDVDKINSINMLEEEEEGKRVFKGQQFF